MSQFAQFCANAKDFFYSNVRIKNQDLLLTWKNSKPRDAEHAVFKKILTFFDNMECWEGIQKKIKMAANLYCLKVNACYR